MNANALGDGWKVKERKFIVPNTESGPWGDVQPIFSDFHQEDLSVNWFIQLTE